MEFWGTIVGLVQRKRVIIPAVLVAVTLGTLAYLGTPNSYVSSTTMVLTTTEYGGTESQDPTSPTELTNPMLNFNDSLRTTSAILIEAMNTKDVAAQLGALGPNRLIVNDGRTNPDLLGLNGPFLYIVGRSTSATEAKRIVVDAQALMRDKLRDWQSELNAPDKTFISLVDVVPPSAPEPDRSRGTKLGILAFLFGFLLSMGIAYFRNQRRARRARAAAAQTVVDTTLPLGEGRRAPRPPSRSPVLVPDDEEDAEPAVVSTAVNKNGDRAAVPTPRPAKTEPAVVPTTLKRQGELAVVPAPVKIKVRSRNR